MTCCVHIWERHVLLLLHERRSRVQDACRRVRIHAYEQLCAVSLVCCVYTGGAACTATPLGAACAAPPSAATRPGTSCLSPYTYPRIRAAVCYLLDVMSTDAGAACAAAPPRRHHRVPFACRRVRIRACEPLCAVSMMCWEPSMYLPSMYLGAACAAAPPRRHSRVRAACRRVRIHAYEQLCAVSLACCVYTWVQLVLRLPWEQLVLLLLHGDATGYFLFVAVHAYTHASSCVLSP